MSRLAELIRRSTVEDSKDSSVHSRKSAFPEEALQEVIVDDELQLGHEGSHHSHHSGSWRPPSRALSTQAEAPEADEHTEAESPRQHPRLVTWYLATFFTGMQGGLDTRQKVPQVLDMALGWLGAFVSILAISVLHHWGTPSSHFDFLVASFGASAVLLFGTAEGKMSQPRHLIGGHVISAIVGCTVRLILKDVIWLSSAIGMAFALVIMQLTCTLHPPGGATALIASSQPVLLRGAGYSLALVVLVDALIMLSVALVINNLRPSRRYPTFWI